ncbi:Iron-sulfur cluster carrier protein [subsurface metagenome]
MAEETKAEKIRRGVRELQVDMNCSMHCEMCEKFFICKNPEKLKIFERRRMSRVVTVMKRIDRKVAVCAGKGGVGKSMCTVQFSTVLASRGNRVAVLDQDLDGPCIPKMLGLTDKKLVMSDSGIIPVEGIFGMKIVSLGFITTDKEIVNWFQEKRRNATEEFLSHVDYGELDYLFIDLPPGTSSDAMNIMEYIPDLDGMIIVTNSTTISQGVAKRATIMALESGVNLLGIVENMSGIVCPYCGNVEYPMQVGGGERLANELDVPFLGRIPLDPINSECDDKGVPFVVENPDSLASKAVTEITDKIIANIEEHERMVIAGER